jgi:hypothetical protein
VKQTLIALAAALALSATAHAGGPAMRVGVAEDFVKQPDLVSAKAKMSLVRLAGFDTVRVTVIWRPGETAASADEATQLRNLEAAARLSGVRVILSVYHFGSRTTPLTDEARSEFARFTASLARSFPSVRDFIIGNEPNLNRFWLPQFHPDGSNAASPAYLQLLAQTYDALKAVSPEIQVIGGSVSPRGSDNHLLSRHTHSPTKFIRDLGLAYRASGRTRPIMDQFAFHPYGDNSSQAPRDSAHPNTTSIGLADYGKLVGLLGEAFDGTAQAGSSLPILYDEFGVEAQIPAGKARLYSGTEPETIKPVDESTQAAFYRQAIEMAFCQPNVRGIMLFHLQDEPERLGWQSGLFYTDGSPKSNVKAVVPAAEESRRGVIARCEGLALTPKARRFRAPAGTLRSRTPIVFRLDCDIDCSYTARLERLPTGRTVLTKRGRAVGRVLTVVRLAARAAPGRYRISLDLQAALNAGPPVQQTSASFRVARRS